MFGRHRFHPSLIEWPFPPHKKVRRKSKKRAKPRKENDEELSVTSQIRLLENLKKLSLINELKTNTVFLKKKLQKKKQKKKLAESVAVVGYVERYRKLPDGRVMRYFYLRATKKKTKHNVIPPFRTQKTIAVTASKLGAKFTINVRKKKKYRKFVLPLRYSVIFQRPIQRFQPRVLQAKGLTLKFRRRKITRPLYKRGSFVSLSNLEKPILYHSDDDSILTFYRRPWL
jgi:hypothetical protein